MITSWIGPLQEELRFPSWISLTRRRFVITLARPLSQDQIYWPSRGPQHRVTMKDTVSSNLLLLSRFVKGNTLKTILCWCAFKFFMNLENTSLSSLKQNVFWSNRNLSSVVNVARPQSSILTQVITRSNRSLGECVRYVC